MKDMQQKKDETKICGLILAAGLSSRMGDFKPLMPLRGKTVIENTVDSMLAGGASQIVVVTGYRAEELEQLLGDKYGESILFTRNQLYASTDMLTSIQIGCAKMPPCQAFFLLPGDMPVIRNETFRRLLKKRSPNKQVTFPTLDGRRKHPPLISSRLIPNILAFQKEGGLRMLWKELEDQVEEIPVDDKGVWVDLDTRTDYQSCVREYT